MSKSNLKAYLSALWGHWVSSVSLIFLIGSITSWVGKRFDQLLPPSIKNFLNTFPDWLIFLIALLSLFIMSYKAWKDKADALEKSQKKETDYQIEIKDLQKKSELNFDALLSRLSISTQTEQTTKKDTESRNLTTVTWGINTNIFANPGSKDRPASIVIWKNTTGIVIEVLKGYIENNKLFISTDLYGSQKLPKVPIINNQNTIMALPWDTNFNETAFEIVDDKLHPRLQLIYKSSNHVVINGIFNVAGGILVIEGTNVEFYNCTPIDITLKRMFKYPSRKYRGQELESKWDELDMIPAGPEHEKAYKNLTDVEREDYIEDLKPWTLK